MPELATDVVAALIALARHIAGGLYFALVHPGQRSFIGQALIFVVLAALYFWWRAGRGGRLTIVDGLKRVFAKDYWLHESAVLDYKFFVVDKALEFTVLSSALLSANWIARGVAAGASRALGWAEAPFEPAVWAMVLFGAVSLVAYDTGYSIGHYLTHKVPFLWELHKLHHSAEVLTPVTNFREHPGDRILLALCYAPLVGVVDGVFFLLFGIDAPYFTLFGVNAVFIPYYLLVSFRHSNVFIRFGPVWGRIFSSPAQHQVHHSKIPKHWDKNFAQIFAFIDLAMGTLYLPDEDEEVEFGIDEPDHGFHSLRAMYIRPIVGAINVLRRRSGRAVDGQQPEPGPT